ncbi:rho GTPase-activating protein 1 isoform X2 [Narcine bancroftii]|uniref:rho GTPase-activating protein 1 isoform X2 n=1 Tax=Narcine bancroftii TaxID=1343680 RepID=UPI003830FFA9
MQTFLTEENRDGLEGITSCFVKAAKLFGLEVSLKKTEVVHQPAPQEENHVLHITVGEPELKTIHQFIYLGCTISSDAKTNKVVDNRLTKANSAFGRLYKSLEQQASEERHKDKECSPEVVDPPPNLKWDDPFYDIARRQIVEVAGDDNYGRKVIVFSACRMPPSHQLDHTKLLQYLKHTLDKYVESDYSVVYFHYGLTSQNKPSFTWLIEAYKEFDRKYKKNIKALYIVHPTRFIKALLIVFKPIISMKFGRKILYMNHLGELEQFLKCERMVIPACVKKFDDTIRAAQKPLPPVQTKQLPHQQFGINLSVLRSKDPEKRTIPLVMEQTIAYIKMHGLNKEGIFRRSANVCLVKEVLDKYNNEVPVTKQAETMARMIQTLPEDNYILLQYLLSFLLLVADNSELNKMTLSNLALVFGPTLMWAENAAISLSAINPINHFAQLLLEKYNEIFSATCDKTLLP